MQRVIFTTVNENEFRTMIEKAVGDAMRKRTPPPKSKPEISDKYLSGKEVDTFLKISPTTRHEYAKQGILIKHKIGGRVLYRREEVEKALIALEAKRA